MSYHVMPFIYLNMGGELIYIIQYRLRRQKIEKPKSQRVLRELVCTLLNKECLEKIFEPQEIYSQDYLRYLFEQIIQSSIMHLSSDSMNKLFDLMVVSTKYQTLLCKEPSELVLVTLNHLNGIKECFTDPLLILDVINHAQTLFMEYFVDTPLWEMAAIRYTILNFFHGIQIKVSRFINENRQLNDGRFVLFSEKNTEHNNGVEQEIELPYGSMAPGTVRYTVNGGQLRVESFPVSERFKVVLEHQDFCKICITELFQERAVSRGTVLGQNMFKTNPSEQEKENLADTSMLSDSGNEVQLLIRLLTGVEDVDTKNNFSFNLFEDEIDLKPQECVDQKSISLPLCMPTNNPTTSTVKKATVQPKKSLIGAVKRLKSSESRVSDSSLSQGRGAKMLQMMDEAVTETITNLKPNAATTT